MSEPLTREQLDHIDLRAKRADDEICRVAADLKRFRMSIPPQPDDTDSLIVQVCRDDVPRLLAYIRLLEAKPESPKGPITATSMFAPHPDTIYRHYKGGYYQVLKIARHTETDEEIVIYKSLTHRTVWARPLEEWLRPVNGQPHISRFLFVGALDS